MTKRKKIKDKQQSTTLKMKDRATGIPLTAGVKLGTPEG